MPPRSGPDRRPAGPPSTRYRHRMPLDETLLAEMRETKAQIDRLQDRLKELVARLQENGATTQEITEALRR